VDCESDNPIRQALATVTAESKGSAWTFDQPTTQKRTAMSIAKVVVVTGVSSGIGRAVAMKFVKQGCQVFGTVRNAAKAQEVAGVTLIAIPLVPFNRRTFNIIRHELSALRTRWLSRISPRRLAQLRDVRHLHHLRVNIGAGGQARDG
jgi:nucleoside-diphosphate-sugar epimerase